MVGPTAFLKLSTKQDFANNMAEYPVEGLQAYQNLYDARLNWFNQLDNEGNAIVVESIEAGVNNDTHRVIMSGGGMEEQPEFIQQELRLDLNALMFLKGFTVEELEGILGI
jgi:glucose-6-phosphate isomerase